MSDKPSYLGLLNAIAVGEAGGADLFTSWAENTASAEVRAVLQTVALREAEHSVSFAKRIDQLGYSVRDRPDPKLADRIAIAKSKALTDREKFDKLGFGAPRRDGFARLFEDSTIDIETGTLLGRFVSEERDTGRRLDACYTALAVDKPAKSKKKASTKKSK
jgi:hypothetical protein